MTRVDELFAIRYGQGLQLNTLKEIDAPNGVHYVSRARTNNGVVARVVCPADIQPGLSGEMTVALNGEGGALVTFLQPQPFVTGFHVAILTAKTEMTDNEKLWWARCIWQNHYRYGFGRQANRTLGGIDLPDSIPSWVNEARLPNVQNLAESGSPTFALSDTKNWRWFRLDSLFEVRKGRRLTKRAQQPGTTPYIGSSAFNNGITNLIDSAPMFPANVLTVPYNGSVGHAFYQPVPFAAGDDVHILIPRSDEVDKFALLFLAAVIRHEKYRFTYGRKWHLGRMRESTIKLPATAAGLPDLHYMSDYVKGLRLSAAVV